MDEKSGATLLAGGDEFSGRMADADRQALLLTGKKDPSVCIVPAAAAPDGNYERAGSNGVNWFQYLGIQNVHSPPVIDKASSNDHRYASILAKADMIYLLGGFPGYLAKILQTSRCWMAMLQAHGHGAVIGGSSAGAMVLCDWFLNPETDKIEKGLGLISDMIIIPHYRAMGRRWIETIRGQMPDLLIVGIDEQTGMIQDHDGLWRVYGKGSVTVIQDITIKKYSPSNAPFSLRK